MADYPSGSEKLDVLKLEFSGGIAILFGFGCRSVRLLAEACRRRDANCVTKATFDTYFRDRNGLLEPADRDIHLHTHTSNPTSTMRIRDTGTSGSSSAHGSAKQPREQVRSAMILTIIQAVHLLALGGCECP
jgi:hypothetical protein